MTLSPKKYVSNYTSSTINRGVEAKEIEIAYTRLDLSDSNMTQYPDRNEHNIYMTGNVGAVSPSQDSSAQGSDETASYIQVVVQKHHKKRELPAAAADAQTSPRLPKSSSPIKADFNVKPTMRGPCGDGAPTVELAPGLFVFPHHLMMPYHAMPAQVSQQYAGWSVGAVGGGAVGAGAARTLVEAGSSARSSGSFKKLVREQRARAGAARTGGRAANKKQQEGGGDEEGEGKDNAPPKTSFWEKLTKITDISDVNEQGPERVEVWYLGDGSGAACERLVAGEGAPLAAGARLAARAERLLARAAAEVCALPACLLSVPILIILQVQRVAYGAARDLALGSVQAASDALLKPALATAWNALLQPPLLLCGAAARQLRRALQPLCALWGDALAPCVQLAGAARLVEVRVAR